VALVGDPELLFLDEPTTGFDPSARREAWGVVKRLSALDKTVLLTTHYREEAEWLADRVAGGDVEITADDLARTLHAVSGWALDHQLALGSLQIVRRRWRTCTWS
jgi:ABC-2 type transport system ATP-binding protein